MSDESDKETAKRLFTSFLEGNGYRKTPERFAILNEIYSHSGHFDVEVLYSSMRDKRYRVSKATLYNTIELLLKCDLVIKHHFSGLTPVYEKARPSSQHDHIIDTNTGRVIEFYDPRIQDIIDTVCEKYGITNTTHSLYIYGKKKN